jgi:hypothetical protein
LNKKNNENSIDTGFSVSILFNCNVDVAFDLDQAIQNLENEVL